MQSSSALPLPAARRTEIVVAAVWPRVFLILTMLAACWLGLAPLFAVPAIVPADAPAARFSAARAMRDLAVVAAAPHPIGSPANQAVRDYLLAEIAGLGLTPEVQKVTTNRRSPLSGIPQVTEVENVLVRIPGSASTGAVLLSGHYDSVPTSAGASDCGSCTVTVLEALRAIDAGEPLQNDLIFLFTDGEEIGIAGATAFMEEHPWANDVALSFVFEAIGPHGASMLYVTSEDNGRVVPQALAATPYPMGYAFLNDIMWGLAGNSGSDLDAFIAGGRAGLGFVYFSLDGASDYHTMADDAATIDPRSIQHDGEHAVNLVRHFGNQPLENLADESNAVFFTILPFVVAAYPGAVALPLALAAVALFLVAVVLGFRRRLLHVGGLLASLLAIPLALAAVVALATFLWWAVRLFNPNLHVYSLGGWNGSVWFHLALLAFAFAIFTGLHLLWRRRLALADLAAGALVWWSLLALLTAVRATGFSYLFAWPLLAASAVGLWAVWRPAAAQRPWPRAMALAIPAAIALLLMAPLVYVLAFYAGRMEAMMGLPLAALPLPFVVLVLGMLAPQLEFVAPAQRYWLPAGALGATLLLLAAATMASGFHAGQPRTNTIVYWLDADTQAARWITVDDARGGRGTGAQLDAWTQQFFAEGATSIDFNPWLSGWFGQSYPALAAVAPAVALPQADMHVVEDHITGEMRRLRLALETPAGVQDTHVVVTSPQPLAIVALNGELLDGDGMPATEARLNIWGRPDTPILFDVLSQPGEPVAVKVLNRYLGLPEAHGIDSTPRPAWSMPAPFADVSDSTIVEQEIVVE